MQFGGVSLNTQGDWDNLTRFLAASIFIAVHGDVPGCFLQVTTEKPAADCSQTAPNPSSRTSAGFALLKAPPRGVIASTPLAVPRANPPPSSAQSRRTRPSQRHGHTRPLGHRVPAPCTPEELSLPPSAPHPARQPRRTPPSGPPPPGGATVPHSRASTTLPPSAPRHWLPRRTAVAHAPRRELELGELARGRRSCSGPGRRYLLCSFVAVSSLRLKWRVRKVGDPPSRPFSVGLSVWRGGLPSLRVLWDPAPSPDPDSSLSAGGHGGGACHQ